MRRVMPLPRALPALPFGIRVLRDAVIVIACIAAGDALGGLPYGSGPADPRMVQVFQAVLGTLGFALVAFHATSRRALHVALTALVIAVLVAVPVATGGYHAFWWVVELVKLGLMALLGAALALLLERLLRA
ncbi:MAG: hypothetical protein U5K43_15100 [Halofilum sp. (in: g-proteobacteria)]|nr:hypothetical protein [Halofilum sp. (in: g-proteobacteria)]